MPAPVFEQRAISNAYTATSPATVGVGGTTVAGRTLVVALWVLDNHPSSVTCGSDTLTMVDSFQSGTEYFSVWEKTNITGGATDFTITFVGFLGSVARAEISGVVSTGPILNATGTGTAVSETFTTTAAEGVAMALVRDASETITSLTAGSGYTADLIGGRNAMLYATDLGAAGSEDMTATYDVSATWRLIGRVYYPTGGGGGGDTLVVVGNPQRNRRTSGRRM